MSRMMLESMDRFILENHENGNHGGNGNRNSRQQRDRDSESQWATVGSAYN
jgi:hypothetical protein